MNTRNPVISVLIFPIAPIAVIFLTHMLCRELWYASYYVPGEDGGEVEPAMAMIGIPFLLIVGSLLLGSMTALGKWGAPRWLTALVRVPVASVALLLSLVASAFFMGQPQAVFSHWQVACAWLLWLASAAALVVQQWDRLRGQ
ncbi:hypothetical protein ACIPW4_13270 [Pseudomonas sp. NPDC089996]|uniref:hypothetical protein n=1 Tax=Pseudomonas sp. NPDC089996 TaxID=3364474 RepID=UPI0037FA446C